LSYSRNEDERPTLLSLPAELRNVIFQFAYMNSGPIWFLLRDKRILSSMSCKYHKPINGAQYTCRQLYQETEDIELKLNNELLIPGKTFVHMCREKDKRLDNVKTKVTIFGPLGLAINPDEVILHDMILGLARKNPEALVKIRVDDLHFGPGRTLPGFFGLAGTILVAMRGEMLRGVTSKSVKNWQRRCSVNQLNVPNLRFFPAEEDFDEEEFRRLASGNGTYMECTVLPRYAHSMEALVAAVKGWFKNGL
jgi:hypothetical protein